MTQDQIIEMAESCGWNKGNAWDDCVCCSPFNIEDFAKLVASAEREACAKVCEEYETENDITATWLNLVAEAIRARGQE